MHAPYGDDAPFYRLPLGSMYGQRMLSLYSGGGTVRRKYNEEEVQRGGSTTRRKYAKEDAAAMFLCEC